MDIKKKSWIEEKRKNWPDRSLEKTLAMDYPGCKSALDAVKKVLSDKEPKTEVPILPTPPPILTNEDYLLMKQAITDVETALKNIDISKLPDDVRNKIAKMPINTPIEAHNWRYAWLKAIDVYLKGSLGGDSDGEINR